MISAINNNTVSFQSKNTKNTNNEAIKEKVENNTKKIILATAGLAAVGVAGIVLSKKLPTIVSSLNERRIAKQSLNLADDAASLKEEATKLYDDAKGVISDVVGKIKKAFISNPVSIKEDKGKKVFEEFTDGVLKRKSVFVQNADDILLDTVETFKSNGLKDALIVKKGKPVIILSDLKGGFSYNGKSLSTRGAEQIGRVIFYGETGNVGLIQKDLRKVGENATAYAREFRFKDGVLDSAKEGVKHTMNPSSTFIKKSFKFKENAVKLVQESIGSLRASIRKNLDSAMNFNAKTVFMHKK